MKNNIKIAKQLIKIAKQLIAGYAIPGYDKVVFEIKNILSELKNRIDLNDYHFSSVAKIGGARDIRHTFLMSMNKKSNSTSEFFPESISIKITSMTRDNWVVIATSFVVNDEEKAGMSDVIKEYIGNDEKGMTPGGDQAVKDFSLCINNFINKYILLGYQDEKSQVVFEDANNKDEAQSSNFESFAQKIRRFREENKK